MALSALWRRCVSWSSNLSQLVQPFLSPQNSYSKGSANLPSPAPAASSPGLAAPSGSARDGPLSSGKPLAGAHQSAPQGQLQPHSHQGRAVALVPPVRDTRHSPASSANPSGAPLASGSPPDRSTPMDVDSTPALDISLATDIDMEEDNPRGCDISLASDVSMDEDTPRGCDISLASDVPMDEDNTPGCDISLASDVHMDEDKPRGCDISLATDVAMDADTSPPSPTDARGSGQCQVQATRDRGVTPASHTLLRGKVPLKATGGPLHRSMAAGGSSQPRGSSVPMPMDHGDTSGTNPQHKVPSLRPPKQMPPNACSVPSTSKAVLSTGHCKAIGMKAQDPQQHVGTDLPPAQSSLSPHDTELGRRGTKRKRGSEPTPTSKTKAPAARAGADRLA